MQTNILWDVGDAFIGFHAIVLYCLSSYIQVFCGIMSNISAPCDVFQLLTESALVLKLCDYIYMLQGVKSVGMGQISLCELSIHMM